MYFGTTINSSHPRSKTPRYLGSLFNKVPPAQSTADFKALNVADNYLNYLTLGTLPT